LYGEENVKNITLAHQELKMFKKLDEIRKKMIKASKLIDIEHIKVNPFLSLMYYKLSFKAWRKATRKNQIIRQQGTFEPSEDNSDVESFVSDYTYKVEEVSDEEEFVKKDTVKEAKEETKEEVKQND
jgi:hypothetical protein